MGATPIVGTIPIRLITSPQNNFAAARSELLRSSLVEQRISILWFQVQFLTIADSSAFKSSGHHSPHQSFYPISGQQDLHAIFNRANRAYDRIIILSDMQGWIGHYTPVSSFNTWKARYVTAPKIFSFDLAGYGTLQFPERNVYCLAGFSDKTMDILKEPDTDPHALVRKIESIPL